jgi:hypothetical protein
MVVSLMVRVMVRLPGRVRFAGAGGSGFEELGEGGRQVGPPVAELVDDDHVFGAAWWPVVGERQVVGVCGFRHVPLSRSWVRDEGRSVWAVG